MSEMIEISNEDYAILLNQKIKDGIAHIRGSLDFFAQNLWNIGQLEAIKELVKMLEKDSGEYNRLKGGRSLG